MYSNPKPKPILSWTPKVYRIIALYRFRAMILPTLGGLGFLKTPR